MVGSAVPPPYGFYPWKPGHKPKPGQLITTAASLRLSHLLRHHLSINPHFQKLSHLGHVLGLKDLWREKAPEVGEMDFLRATNDVWSATCSSCLSFFNGRENKNSLGDEGNSYLEMPRKNSFRTRRWTNILLAINVVVYIAQIATQGKLMLWGAKINSLIDKGQLWRLVTSSFLHANIVHIMVNCYSLNSVGPTMENICGPKRYLTVYFTSAIASSAMSYWFCKAPAVGASGAIFGLVGSLAVFVTRHRKLVGGAKEDLQQIARVIVVNMFIGLLSKSIDNWGHLGGLLGGAATSWLVGPLWKHEAVLGDGRKVFSDKPPISYLFNKKTLS